MRPKDIASVFTTQMEAARAIGVSKQAISQWKRRKKIPLAQQIALETASEGRLRADVPDSFVKNRQKKLIADDE